VHKALEDAVQHLLFGVLGVGRHEAERGWGRVEGDGEMGEVGEEDGEGLVVGGGGDEGQVGQGEVADLIALVTRREKGVDTVDGGEEVERAEMGGGCGVEDWFYFLVHGAIVDAEDGWTGFGGAKGTGDMV
jgi:hypothetical protein